MTIPTIHQHRGTARSYYMQAALSLVHDRLVMGALLLQIVLFAYARHIENTHMAFWSTVVVFLTAALIAGFSAGRHHSSDLRTRVYWLGALLGVLVLVSRVFDVSSTYVHRESLVLSGPLWPFGLLMALPCFALAARLIAALGTHLWHLSDHR